MRTMQEYQYGRIPPTNMGQKVVNLVYLSIYIQYLSLVTQIKVIPLIPFQIQVSASPGRAAKSREIKKLI